MDFTCNKYTIIKCFGRNTLIKQSVKHMHYTDMQHMLDTISTKEILFHVICVCMHAYKHQIQCIRDTLLKSFCTVPSCIFANNNAYLMLTCICRKKPTAIFITCTLACKTWLASNNMGTPELL